MQNNDNPADPFKKALAEATKVLANDPELSITYSVDPPGSSPDSIRLPQVSRKMTRQEVLLARGTADAMAMRHKYHNLSTFNRYAPQGQMAKDIYDAMETARCEAVGAKDMPGTASNIDAKIENEALRQGFGDIKEASQAPLATAAGYLVRHLATGRELPKDAANVMNLWRSFIEGQTEGNLESLEESLADQASFAKFARQIIKDLGYGDQLGDDPDYEDDSDDQANAEEDDQPDSSGEDDNNEEQDT
ncbi:MAG: cobaltochelatase subunit CobT, partial [Planktomarina sp.]|nr:cobaltochelatase subunit CobT [Planktomarina sp.]